MKTSLVPIEPEKAQIKYPCVMRYSPIDIKKELVVLFKSKYKGIILHEKGTAYNLLGEYDCFNAESFEWREFAGPIYFGAWQSSNFQYKNTMNPIKYPEPRTLLWKKN